MTVQNTQSKISYMPDGIKKEFPIPFRYFNPGDIKVFLGASIASVDFIISEPISESNEGKITFTDPPSSNTTITLKRDLEPLQLLDLQENGSFSAEAIERAYDYLTLLIQDTKEVVGRSILTPVELTGFKHTLLDPSSEAYLKYSSDGKSIEGGITQGDLDTELQKINTALTDIQNYKEAQDNLYSKFLLDDEAADKLLVDSFVALRDEVIALRNNAQESATEAKDAASSVQDQAGHSVALILNSEHQLKPFLDLDQKSAIVMDNKYSCIKIDFTAARSNSSEHEVVSGLLTLINTNNTFSLVGYRLDANKSEHGLTFDLVDEVDDQGIATGRQVLGYTSSTIDNTNYVAKFTYSVKKFLK